MAYRGQPEPREDIYSSSSSYEENRNPEAFYGRNYHYQAPTNGRSRASSIAASDASQQPSQQPFKSAVDNAFDKSTAASAIDPALIAQITEIVKKETMKELLDQVKRNGLAGITSQPVPVSPQHYVPLSPASTSASIPLRDVYTPPSPKHTDSPPQASPVRDPLARDLNDNDDTPTPRHQRSAPIDIPRKPAATRPAPAARMATEDYTPIEKMWQRLFEPDGQPLPRLGEFLRGLALHLIEDYEPKKSLVITPAKLLRFYEEVKIRDETYPWQTIFGNEKVKYPALAKIYRDMRCQYHLVQEYPATEPDVPALTPEGFQEWMTAMIQAYPGAEHERLTKAVLDMPISNANDRKERFPKELSRRMLPPSSNLQAEQRCAAALASAGVSPLRKAPAFPPPPPKSHASASVPNFERERSPYISRPDTKVFDSEDELESSSVPIERQRKPYSVTPGAGKTYDDDLNLRRAQTTAGHAPYPPPSNEAHYHTRTGSQANHPRPRSPSFSSYGTQSDPSVREIPGSYYTSNMHDTEDPTRRYSKDSDKKYDRHRRSTTATDGTYETRPRTVYDDDDYRGRHGSNGYDNKGYDSRRYA